MLTEQPINDETILDELEKCYSDELWNPADPTASYMALDCVAQVPELFFARNDYYGMAYGMEGRFPLASKKFMQYCLNIKTKHKFKNSTKDMGAAIRAVDDIRNAYDCTLLAVHHTGHSQKDRARGSSALLGALDAEFLVDKWNDQQPAKIEVKFTKMKDAKMPEPLNFMHREIELRGADLEDTTSVVLEVCQDKRPQAKKDNLSDKQRKFMQIFDETKGSQNYAKIDDMRDNYYNFLGEAKQDTKKSSYQSVRKQLCEKGLISQTKTTVYDERDNGT